MKNKLSSSIIYLLTLILLILLLRLSFIKNASSIIPTYINSIFSLELMNTTNMEDSSFIPPIPQNEVPIEQVLENGNEISFIFIYNNPDWQRPIYKNYWENVRWSALPNRIHYAMHRVFSTYATASIYYDFIHDLGIAEESKQFIKYESTSPYDYLHIVVMNTLIERVITYRNQIVIVGKPERTGLQAIIIPSNSINPTEGSNNILIQLVTPDGYEVDYTTEILASPK
jgi:hypothetical protein